jgi:hypothetical protein
MRLFGQHVVLDVADGQRALAEQPHHLARVFRLDRFEPSVALALVQFHRRQEVAEILRRHVGQRMRPVFEHAFVGALGLAQVGAPISGDAGVEDVMVAALDDIDGVDLHIAEMGDRVGHGLRAVAERRLCIEPLRAQPDAAGFRFGEGVRFRSAGHRTTI